MKAIKELKLGPYTFKPKQAGGFTLWVAGSDNVIHVSSSSALKLQQWLSDLSFYGDTVPDVDKVETALNRLGE